MLEARNVSKSFPTPRGPLPILTDVSLSLEQGDTISIVGPSGTGKSTLLYILGALEPPTSGTMTLDGRNPYLLAPRELAAFRNTSVGFIFQDHCLLPQCTVLENVLIPTFVAPASGPPRRECGWGLASPARRTARLGQRQASHLIQRGIASP